MPRSSTTIKKGEKLAEKWTEDKAIKLGNDLINWLTKKNKDNEENSNIFFEEYLVIERGYYEEVTSYLCKKFKPFLNLIKKAKKIQELKLIKFGIADRLQPAMTIFVLKNHHDYKDKKEITQDINFKDKITGITFDK